MADHLVVVALGFALGMRHATDLDHVVAVTTIVMRQRSVLAGAGAGLLWGLGHSLTVCVVGSAIILFHVAIPTRVALAMELSVGVMLVVLGVMNVAAFMGRSHDRRPHVHGTDSQLLGFDGRLGRSRAYRLARPLVVGVVHGLAGSAAVALLVLATVRNPVWASAYLLVFGIGTIAGMILITIGIASTFRIAGGAGRALDRPFCLASGVVSILFGVTFAYRIWQAGAL